MLTNLVIIFLLFVANGFFAMSEMAIIAARRARLEGRAEAGSRGAVTALGLARDPGRFLSTVQTGVTLIGVVTGALSNTAISAPLAVILRRVPGLSPALATGIAFTAGVAVITVCSLVIGELVPKQIALRRAESVAVWVARPLAFAARMALPIVALLDFASRAILGLIGISRESREQVSEEEVRTLIAEGMEHGVFHPTEGAMVGRVLRFADRQTRSIMTPRTDVVWIDIDATREDILEAVRNSGHTRLPVGRGKVDDIVGVVHIRDVLSHALAGQPLVVRDLLGQVPAIYEAIPVLRALEILRKASMPFALVVDEYGGFEGIVTLTDVLEAVVGDMPEAARDEEPEIVERPDGTLRVDGLAAIEDVKLRLGLQALPGEDEVSTLGGFMLTRLGRLPKEGDRVSYAGYVFEVLSMDGRRVDKLSVSRPALSAAVTGV